MSRVVLVTGGSRGIGLACAQRFASLGDRVAVTYNSTPPPDGLFSVHCDVTSVASVDAAFAAVRSTMCAQLNDYHLIRHHGQPLEPEHTRDLHRHIRFKF